jgi:hypothetical protein
MRLPLIGLLVFGFILNACAPSVLERSRFAGQEIISNFQAERGEGGNYKVGELVKFSFTLAESGYITLISMDPDTTTGEVLCHEPKISMQVAQWRLTKFSHQQADNVLF